MERGKTTQHNPFLNIIKLSEKKSNMNYYGKASIKKVNNSHRNSSYVKKIRVPIKCHYYENKKNNNHSNNNLKSISKSPNKNKTDVLDNKIKKLNNINENDNDEKNNLELEIIKLKKINLEKDKELEKSSAQINVLINENRILKMKIEQYKERIETMQIEGLNDDLHEENNNNNSNINTGAPNVDHMTYEELLELEDKIGYVNKGFKKEEIDKIPITIYKNDSIIHNNKNNENNFMDKCIICQFEFQDGNSIKKLSCGHVFHSNCIDNWLLKEKVCSFCKQEVIIP